jgi:hypothetical protein
LKNNFLRDHFREPSEMREKNSFQENIRTEHLIVFSASQNLIASYFALGPGPVSQTKYRSRISRRPQALAAARVKAL